MQTLWAHLPSRQPEPSSLQSSISPPQHYSCSLLQGPHGAWQNVCASLLLPIRCHSNHLTQVLPDNQNVLRYCLKSRKGDRMHLGLAVPEKTHSLVSLSSMRCAADLGGLLQPGIHRPLPSEQVTGKDNGAPPFPTWATGFTVTF